MNKIRADFYDLDGEFSLGIELPVIYEHLEDFHEITGKLPSLSADVDIMFDNGHGIFGLELDNVNIFELNYLANCIKDYDILEIYKLQGAVKQIKNDNINVPKIINLTKNIDQNEEIEAYPASNEQELGEFFVDNDLIDEIKNLTGDTKTWVLEHVNCALIGSELKEQYGGIFADDAFVIVGKIEELYDGNFEIEDRNDWVFKIELGLDSKFDDDRRVFLELPASDDEIQEIASNFFYNDISKLKDFSFQSIIPYLEPMDFDMDDIYRLNDLAKNIKDYYESGEFVKYKALIEDLNYIDIENVIGICDFMDDFEFKEDVRDLATYAKTKFQNIVPDELLDCLNVGEYGKNLAEKNGVSITQYGALIPNDSLNITQKLEEQKKNFELQMN